jgi:hypothetical protein
LYELAEKDVGSELGCPPKLAALKLPYSRAKRWANAKQLAPMVEPEPTID